MIKSFNNNLVYLLYAGEEKRDRSIQATLKQISPCRVSKTGFTKAIDR